jgi:thiol:disulfide interchange protein/DsbC/DsbD-like thiol-disulfide interchange protein
MSNFQKLFAVTFLIFSFSISSSLVWSEEMPDRPVQIGLQKINAGKKTYLAVNFKNYPGWHTYWKNPGDAGLPIKIDFFKGNEKLTLKEEEWPSPNRFIEPGDLWAFGYLGEYTRFYGLNKGYLKKIMSTTLELNASWLVCKNICVPGQKKVKFILLDKGMKTGDLEVMNPLSSDDLKQRIDALPENSKIPSYLDMELVKGDYEKSLVLIFTVKGSQISGAYKNSNMLYPFPSAPFNFKHEKIEQLTEGIKGKVEIDWDGEYSTPPETLPTDGQFQKPRTIKFLFNDPVQNKVLVIEKSFSGFSVAKAPPTASAVPVIQPLPVVAHRNVVSKSLLYYLFLAFAGGLILNIMPCVLPVISLKLFGLIKYKNESRKRILKHNLFYTLGIISTFIVLATVVIALKSLGNEVGWGFQLQSPNFIAMMISAIFIFSLNLFGLFEFATPGGKTLGNMEIKDGYVGDFTSGVLATVLSTPCSAPFLGTALTFAFTSSAASIILIFISIALGLSSPFILTAIFPALVSFFPSPGKWMNTAKKILGVTLLLTMFWLADVYKSLTGDPVQLVRLISILIFIFFGIIVMKKGKLHYALPSFMIAILIFASLATTTTSANPVTDSDSLQEKQEGSLFWEKWSEDKMNTAQAEKQLTFIDFTAKWCFTCKINEKLVLQSDEFKKISKENNMKLLLGDWTKKDEVIGSYLRKNGLVGVPAYFIQQKNGTLVNLGEAISIEKIKQVLQ